jgi:hypothetical protein
MKFSRIPIRFSRRVITVAVGLGAASALAMGAAAAATAGPSVHAPRSSSGPVFSRMVPSPGISACLKNAGASVAIFPHKLNDTMVVSVHGLPANAEFDLFVIEKPNAPFGVSWYQTDIETGPNGTGSATVQGIFDRETFTAQPGATPGTFTTTHQFHLGLWFNDPQLPFDLGCEPGAATPKVTVFNGEQHAGIQVLNTAQDPAGPLSRVHR